MNTSIRFACLSLLIVCGAAAGDQTFEDHFDQRLENGWSWIRENRDGWRVGERRLEIRIEPGNMWGPENNARNILVHPIPDAAPDGETELSVTVENRPTEQYEQADLVWYYDDSHMVKLGQELVDGKLSIVMGREENDRTRTIAIIPIKEAKVRLKLTVTGKRIRGEFRLSDSGAWHLAGECDLPVHETPKAAIQCYQGPAKADHWAHITDFRIRTRSAP
jgi:regulation of enolase protein 1 (concanavalin A-like superfamily)